MTKPKAIDEEIKTAAKKAFAHEFIRSLPYGYDIEIGERGVKLSGGQRQRISLARFFLKNPSNLLLDEATRALDNESEKLVQESILRLVVVLIAHRLSSVTNADRILIQYRRKRQPLRADPSGWLLQEAVREASRKPNRWRRRRQSGN
ncbi:ATP-binding cassette domain-containing protein [Paenibacillus sp. GYB003]|uniref:ATP-binding cassette domain-containing protein n=1 Tax=Paenibacillus sp. GYB003 TaxID=2994392 RepID=UPI002F96BAFC